MQPAAPSLTKDAASLRVPLLSDHEAPPMQVLIRPPGGHPEQLRAAEDDQCGQSGAPTASATCTLDRGDSAPITKSEGERSTSCAVNRQAGMMSDGWVPLSLRGTEQEKAWQEVLFEGVPAHMAPGLYAVVLQRLTSKRDSAQVLQRRLRLDLSDTKNGGGVQGVLDQARADPVVMLNVVDCLLDEARLEYARSQDSNPTGRTQKDESLQGITAFVTGLMKVLHEADSAYEVSFGDGRPWLLQRRVDATAAAAARQVFAHGTPASTLLAAAWTATFRRTPDLDAAYRDVVLAVESVATAVLTPKDPSPSLGKAIAHLMATTGRWTVAELDDQSQRSAETLLAMLQTVWQNHQRHVSQGGAPPQPVVQEEAESVLFLAITLVQWFERGCVRAAQ